VDLSNLPPLSVMSPMTGEEMSKSKLQALLILGGAALAVFPIPAGAEQSGTEGKSAELPPIVVEGASIAVKPVAKTAPKAAIVIEDGPDASPKKPSAQVAKKKPMVPAEASVPAQEQKKQPGDSGPVTSPVPAAGDAIATDNANAGSANSLPIEKVGAAVSVVTAADLKAQQVRTVVDALRSLPGVSVSQSGGVGNLTAVRIRGGESQHTLVLIDGVELNSNNTNGFFDFENLTAEEIESIEVLRGPQSGLYGSGAIGGVINIVTKAGKGPLTLKVMGEGGSFGTEAGSAQISGGTDRAHGALTVQRRHTDGFNISPLGGERDGSDISSLAFHGGVMVFDNLQIDGALRYSSLRTQRDGFDGSASVGGFVVANDDASTFTQKLWTGRLAATLDTFDQAWTHQVFVSRANTDTADHDKSAFPIEFKSDATAFNYGYTSTLKIDGFGQPTRHFLTGRVEQLDENFEQPTFDTLLRERGRTSVTGEVRGEYFDHLFLSGSVRQDWNTAFDDFTTWHTAASLNVPGTVVRLHASTGTGVKFPSFSEQFGFFFGFTPNPDLKPESSFGWDGGAEVTLLGGKAVVDVTYFDQNLENEIATKFLANFTSTAVNLIGESTRRGVEVSARAIVFPGLTVGGAYTFLDASEPDGIQEIRRPVHSGKVDVNYVFLDNKANINLSAVYNGDMKDVAFDAGTFAQNRVTLDEYWLLRLAASYKVTPGVELFGRVENLLDQDYQDVFGFETAGLAAYGGIRFTYEEPSTLSWGKGN
jgi:vitamin B12 transporter